MNRVLYIFKPLYKSTLWGGDRIAAYKDECVCGDKIGESWELSDVPGKETTVADGEERGLTLGDLCRKYGAALVGEECAERFSDRFPLLIKIIDAQADLSVQVHPDDRLAAQRHGCPGKTEMWYVVGVDGNAWIYSGFKRLLTPDRLPECVAKGEFKGYLARYHSRPGDSFFIPAGRVHSIGAGNLLIEIQQSSDITYRIDDFGRLGSDGHPRQLHLEQARDAIDYAVGDSEPGHPRVPSGSAVPLVDCRYFTTDVMALESGEENTLPLDDTFRVVICVEGEITLEAGRGERVILTRGHSALVAAQARHMTIRSTGAASRLLLTRV